MINFRTLLCISICALVASPAGTTSSHAAESPQTFDQWATQLPPNANEPTDDADGDGIVNLVEYAFGLDPFQPGQQGLPTVTFDNGILTYSFARPKSVVGVEHVVRVSNTITGFSQLLHLDKVSETETTETWGATIQADQPSEFAWSAVVRLSPPELTGHAGSSRPSEFDAVLPYDVQAAFNNDTFFWRVRYPGNEGKRHDYLRFTDGTWVREGGDRRDAQATMDNEPSQGSTAVRSTTYEQRTSIMVSDPSATSHLLHFDKFGCFLACHDQSRHMPEWTLAAGEDTKYIDPGQVSDGAASSDKVLDLWHWRGARSNPIARADDQYIQAKLFTNTTTGDDGGRKGDAGSAVFLAQNIVDGHPEYVFDPATTGGKFAFHWEDFWATPMHYISRPDAVNLGPNAPNPGSLTWAEAVAAGYAPVEGDTVPRRVLRAGAGSRADITGFGSKFVRETPDTVFGQDILGIWEVQMQRLLDTGNDDDVALVPGNTYHVGFEVHLWEYTTRDHYVSFPASLSLGTGGNIEAVDLRGPGADGRDVLPDWEDTASFPITRIHLFQPGISTWEFLSGTNALAAKVFWNPVTGSNVDQIHGGAFAVSGGTTACTACHKVRNEDPAPPLFDAGSMETLTRQRGGVWAATPVQVP